MICHFLLEKLHKLHVFVIICVVCSSLVIMMGLYVLCKSWTLLTISTTSFTNFLGTSWWGLLPREIMCYCGKLNFSNRSNGALSVVFTTNPCVVIGSCFWKSDVFSPFLSLHLTRIVSKSVYITIIWRRVLFQPSNSNTVPGSLHQGKIGLYTPHIGLYTVCPQNVVFHQN